MSNQQIPPRSVFPKVHKARFVRLTQVRPEFSRRASRSLSVRRFAASIAEDAESDSLPSVL